MLLLTVDIATEQPSAADKFEGKSSQDLNVSIAANTPQIETDIVFWIFRNR